MTGLMPLIALPLWRRLPHLPALSDTVICLRPIESMLGGGRRR
jgi:hypothetical protein